VLGAATQAPVAMPQNFAGTEPGQGSAVEGEAGHGVAKQRGCSGGAVGKARARGKGCVKTSQATAEVDLGGVHNRAHLPRSSAREWSGQSDDAGWQVTYRTI
jgi:hypothetical protein